ncbi:unnamed protein product [Symbiodinium sp. CCMP2592]|nr:unnamed protein product [Symbiodinium sp. CCMP2592]
MKRPMVGSACPGHDVKRQHVNDTHGAMASQITSASTTSLSQLSQAFEEDMLSQTTAPFVKRELFSVDSCWTPQELGEDGGMKQELLEEKKQEAEFDNGDIGASIPDVAELLEEKRDEAAFDDGHCGASIPDVAECFEEKKEDSDFGNGDCGASVPDDVAQEPGQPRKKLKKYLTAGEILEQIKSGHFESLASSPHLQKDIGIKDSAWERLPARDCVHSLIGQYNLVRQPHELYHFEYSRSPEGVTAWLVTTGFFQRQFRGFARHGSGVGSGKKNKPAPFLDKRAAEQVACEAFKRDAQVQEVRQLLPPRMDRIRNFFFLTKAQRDELEELGYKPSVVQSDIAKAIYNGFRALGCRNVFWDEQDGLSKNAA